MDTITEMLTALGLPLRSQAVYLDLLRHGEAGARQLATRLTIPRSSLYDHVRPLLILALVIEKEKDGKAIFAVHDIDDLDRLVAKQTESLLYLRSGFKRAKNNLSQTITVTTEPKIKFVEGKEGVITLLNEMLWESGEEILTVWPYEEMLSVLSPDDLEIFNRKRIKQNIALRSIWTGPKPTARHIWRGGDFKVERRLAPKKYDAAMAYSIYGDKVSFFSSARELYGFVVHSTDFAKLMRTQFGALWEVSKVGK